MKHLERLFCCLNKSVKSGVESTLEKGFFVLAQSTLG